ncbi:hypothetical protein MPTK1_1g19560 [Marchantia polymorpha subsp. ruderalis]|uniref:CHCH domain-containing protein n=2 Tax=Marchantia polymorpha TaxID=3197 RepID=A0A176W6K6_MARPO|nr:hypothetical protein AXG93_2490s1440 [Marchantia polymorpha subsp. ruderalis]PTQ50281.1 hypothetical protein MARPO_0001s0295 [Marchantia polymorpha]PTQ50282.1 hypothetical protein MARPO_0001s0295 [Marchantia polymorpha]PTQ50283.1 hypothetical protein MARPO_0001s0295 [Marchantia polymorpha]BBM99201.1 hypothetical protein Mp_1g19560 [Marchantia polymorpha subsp. ruderalis]|eukprot:PTQ50281.1 hypothetical protein MARPO_0001s0295 [Marchantia polymorpha]
MSNPFALQVTPELMQRLTRDEKKPQRRRPAREKRESVSQLPSAQRIIKDDQDSQAITSATGGPARDPFLPSFLGPQAPFGGIFGSPIPPAADFKKELAPVYQAIEESEKIAQKLHKQGDHELEKVKEMARELKDKQYRAPSHTPPCSSERAACVDCYKENQKNPLLCAKLVQAFVGCSRHAQEEFVASVVS